MSELEWADLPFSPAPVLLWRIVGIEDGALVWEETPAETGVGDARPWNPDPAGALDAFLTIAEAGDIDAAAPRVLAFATTYGPLQLCEHGVPGGHFPDGCAPVHREPLAVWLGHARQLRALVDLAATVRQEVTPTQMQIAAVSPELAARDHPGMDTRRRRQLASLTVAAIVNEWLRNSGTLPFVFWLADDPPLVSWGQPTAASAVALGLMFALLRPDQLWRRCSACGRTWDRDRRPRRGDPVLCSACAAERKRTGASGRSRGYYWRNREKVLQRQRDRRAAGEK
jgi:hypothetical protein